MKIVQYPHPALRTKARPITAIDQTVRLRAGKMLELMYENRGLGLAGNQVAWPFQMFVTNFKGDAAQRDFEHVIINPEISEQKGSIEAEEGCLSFPKLFKKVRRAKSIRLVGYNLEGQSVEYLTSQLPQEVSELASRVLQHEWDHLRGVLYIDKMTMVGKLSSRATLKDFERDFRKSQERGEMPADAELERQLAALLLEP